MIHVTGPADLAIELARQLAHSAAPLPLRPQDSALLAGATSFRFGPEDSRVGWSLGRGPMVLLTHGWGGRGTQMAGLARSLVAQGFRCAFFDAGGHGDSRSEPVGFDTFIRDVDALTRYFGGAVFAWIGHSAGGLSMMAARALKAVRAEHYVCIAAPLFPYVPLETIRATLGASQDVLDQLKPILAAQFESQWPLLEAGAAYLAQAGSDLLLAYDRDDERVRASDADEIAAGWPGTQIVKTSRYGHNRIVQAPEVWAAIHAFLGPGRAAT